MKVLNSYEIIINWSILKYFIKYAILKIKSATDRRLVLEFKQKNNRSIPRSLAVIFLHLQYLFQCCSPVQNNLDQNLQLR